MSKNYLTTRDAAQLLGVSLRSAQQWVEKGLLEGWKTAGGHRRITRSSVNAALKKLQSDTQASAQPYVLPVLIIEDDQTFLQLYRLQMAKWPFAVSIYTAPNGYEGLVMVGEVAPRLLICDLRLPGVNGFQIVRALCNMERYRDMVIVVVSGMDGVEVDAHGGLPARVELMGKPINFDRLQVIAAEINAETRKSAVSPAPTFMN